MPLFVRKIERSQEITQYYSADNERDLNYVDQSGRKRGPSHEIFDKPKEKSILDWEKVPDREAALLLSQQASVISRPKDDD